MNTERLKTMVREMRQPIVKVNMLRRTYVGMQRIILDMINRIARKNNEYHNLMSDRQSLVDVDHMKRGLCSHKHTQITYRHFTQCYMYIIMCKNYRCSNCMCLCDQSAHFRCVINNNSSLLLKYIKKYYYCDNTVRKSQK